MTTVPDRDRFCQSQSTLVCHYCEGKGYFEIRDCSGEIQRSETCVFCQGTGMIQEEDDRD